MAAATSTINLKVDPEVKEQAKRVFDALGLDMSTAINLFLRQAIRANGIPFLLINSHQLGYVNPPQIYIPRVSSAGVVVPADWDDPEDDIYDAAFSD